MVNHLHEALGAANAAAAKDTGIHFEKPRLDQMTVEETERPFGVAGERRQEQVCRI